MRILIACEFSNTVRDAFLRRGHDAYSCDLQSADHPNPNYKRHIRGDVRPLLKEEWDLVVAHPPCTYLSNMTACFYPKGSNPEESPRWSDVLRASKFFLECYNASSPKVCVENPRQLTCVKKLINIEHDQIIQPYYFGEHYSKATCLWLRGLPLLKPTNIVEPILKLISSGNRRATQGMVRGNLRSKTFECIADAMAAQWG